MRHWSIYTVLHYIYHSHTHIYLLTIRTGRELSIYRNHFVVYNSRKITHSSPVRARYGVSFVSANLTEVSYITAIYRESILTVCLIDCTNSILEPVLIRYQWCPVVHSWEWFDRTYSIHKSIKCVSKSIQRSSQISSDRWVTWPAFYHRIRMGQSGTHKIKFASTTSLISRRLDVTERTC